MTKERQLPKHWEMKRFEDVLDYVQPSKFIVKSTEYNDDYKTPVLTAGKSFVLGKTNEVDGIFKDLPVIIFDDFTTANKFVNFPFKVKSSAMKILKPKEGVNIKFVHYFMQTVRVTFDTHKRYWISVFAKEKIPYPPLSEQLAIVQKIEELFSDLDNSIASLKTAQQQIKTFKMSVLKAAFEGRLTSDVQVKAENVLPEGWRWVKLGEISKKITDGEHATPKRADSGILLLSARNVQNGFLSLTNVDYIPEHEYNRIAKRCNPEEGDVLISCSGSVGRVSKVPKNLKFGLVRSVALIKLDRLKFDSSFLEFLLQSPQLQAQIEKGKKQTAQANLFLGPIKNLDVIDCPLQQQQLIVSEIESRYSVADKLEESINQSLLQAETLRQSILKKAFEGKLI